MRPLDTMMKKTAVLVLLQAALCHGVLAADVVMSDKWRFLQYLSGTAFDVAKEIAAEQGKPLDDETIDWIVGQSDFSERLIHRELNNLNLRRQERNRTLRDGCDMGHFTCVGS